MWFVKIKIIGNRGWRVELVIFNDHFKLWRYSFRTPFPKIHSGSFYWKKDIFFFFSRIALFQAVSRQLFLPQVHPLWRHTPPRCTTPQGKELLISIFATLLVNTIPTWSLSQKKRKEKKGKEIQMRNVFSYAFIYIYKRCPSFWVSRFCRKKETLCGSFLW